MIKQLWRKYGINPFDRLLKKAVKHNQKTFLLCWNRGLGDIALGMYALVYRIRHFIPDAQITFVTRSDLEQGFRLLENITLLIDPNMKRKQAFDLDACLQAHNLKRTDFDVVIEHPDPTYWLKWQLGTLVPRLQWVSEWEELYRTFAIDPTKQCIGVHVHSETSYGYEKNWPHSHWQEFFNAITRHGTVQVLLFGHTPSPLFPIEGVIDLRGKTTLAQMLSLLKNTCQCLVVPDSGVLSLIYFLDAKFPLKIVSLWADPNQGVLKQNVASPNPLLVHIPLKAPQEDLRKLTVANVLQEVTNAQKILSLLETLEQPHLAKGLELLSHLKQNVFLQQLQAFDLSLRKRQLTTLASGQQTPHRAFSPLENYARAGNQEDSKRGEALIAQGKAGCIILAGGQGTRLGALGPKGKVPVSSVKGKSLFQLFAERTKRASERAGRPLHIAIMTSPLNDQETRQFFEENAFFGLIPSQVSFFLQPVLPFCDDKGNWLLEEEGKLAVGPDGNGHVFSAFAESGLFETWKRLGIELFSIIPVDNPLADPFDPEMIGFQERSQADVVLKTVPRLSAHEKMGVIVQMQNKLGVVEYTELSLEDAQATTHDGSFKYSLANPNLFCFHSDLITRTLQTHLPLHLARKTTRHFDQTVSIWKFETFIFDLLQCARNPHVLLCERANTYAPLKNAEGDKSLTTVRAALNAFDHSIFKDLSGTEMPNRSFELDPAFYYPTRELKQQWQGRELPDLDYIEP